MATQKSQGSGNKWFYVALGAIVADELYGQTVPMVVLEQSAFDSIAEGDAVRIECDGTVKVTASGGRGCAAE